MALLWTICVCGLFSVVLSASPECEELIKPLDMTNPSVVNGKWVFVASVGKGSTKWNKYLETLSSSWYEIATTSDGKLSSRWADRVAGQCILGTAESTMSGTKMTTVYEGDVHEGELLQSCPDCLLMTDISTENDIPCKYLFLSKREGSSLTEDDITTVKKQAACLGMEQIFYTFSGTDFCAL